jgi:hypothetical protein
MFVVNGLFRTIGAGGYVMLSYLLGLIQEFEGTHGRVPILVTLNTRHMEQLLRDCPNLSRDNEPFPFGFRISVLPECTLAHPVVSVLPVVRATTKNPCWAVNGHGPQGLSGESVTSYLRRQAAS